jgi:riboflavin kinase/FMN adenylyltransferase
MNQMNQARETADVLATTGPVAPPRSSFQILPGADPVADELAGGVLLLGNFDGFHLGHRALLRAAADARRAGPLGIMSVEPHPRQLFDPGASPFRITTERIKHEAFRRLGFTFAFAPRFDQAFAGQSAEAFVEDLLVRALRVAHVVVGEDFRFGHKRRGDVSTLRSLGADLGFGVTAVAAVRQQDVVCSSSLIREMLRLGDVAGASALLGHPWSVEVAARRQSSGVMEIGWPDAVIAPPAGTYRVRLRRLAASATIGAGSLEIGARGCYLLLDDARSPAIPAGALALDVLDRDDLGSDQSPTLRHRTPER